MLSISEYLLKRLSEVGCKHIFGVPGDFVLGFFNRILESEVGYVGTCNELNAAYAADGYARIRGIGCVSTTYSVGELSALNGVAGSYAERVPVVKISGVPATQYFHDRPLLHHSLDDYWAAYKCYANVTVAQVILSSGETAAKDIDQVLRACLTHKAPVYIGLPTDMVDKKCIIKETIPLTIKAPKSDPCALEEAVLEAVRMLRMSRRPLFIPGVEINRRNLQKVFLKLIETTSAPFATMMLSKSIVDERHPQFLGLYCGDRSRPYVQRRVEDSDCLVILGERLTDFNTGGFSAALDKRSTIECTRDTVRIMFHSYHDVYIEHFIAELTRRLESSDSRICKEELTPATKGCVHRPLTPAPSQADNDQTWPEMTMSNFFDRMAAFFKPNGIIIAETGASLFSAAECLLPAGAAFIGQTFYGSIGYTVGATLGACIAAPDRPVYLFVGDGSFQVTCPDLSTMIRYKCSPTIFLLNNDGYTIERVIVDRTYNDIQPWKYHLLPQIYGGKPEDSADCRTMEELEKALGHAESENAALQFIEIHLDRWDCNESLRRAGRGMAIANGLLEGEELDKARAQRKHDMAEAKGTDGDDSPSYYSSVVRKPHVSEQ